MVYNFFDKKSAATCANNAAGTSVHTGTGISFEKQQLTEE